jgi:hypothetical protein
MQIDVSRKVEIRASPFRLILVAAGALTMSALGIAIGWRLLPDTAPGSFKQLMGWAGAGFFAACFLAALSRLSRARQPTLLLSPEGFMDTRLSSEYVPWSVVQKLSTWDRHGTRMIIVTVPEPIWRTWPLTRLARWTRSPNRWLGVQGFAVVATEFDLKFDDLLELFTVYCKAHGGRIG